jgi:hypothetical protein
MLAMDVVVAVQVGSERCECDCGKWWTQNETDGGHHKAAGKAAFTISLHFTRDNGTAWQRPITYFGACVVTNIRALRDVWHV